MMRKGLLRGYEDGEKCMLLHGYKQMHAFVPFLCKQVHIKAQTNMKA